MTREQLLHGVVVARGYLIADAGKFWKFGTTWVFVLIGAMPDIYNGIASMGWVDEVPDKFKWILRGMAASGIVIRVLKQRRLP